MIALSAHAGTWLLLQATADTTLVRQVGQTHSWYEVLSAIASGVTTLALLILVVLAVGAAIHAKRGYARMQALVQMVTGDAKPLVLQAATIVSNLDTITTALRDEIEVIQKALAATHEKLDAAMELTEKRLGEFNALLTVVQEEAETVFVATASTVRGVRAGAAALHHEDDDGTDEASVLVSSEERDDGNTDDPDDAQTGPARPRVRTRRRGYA